eukprot:16445138-Heterocapsa_arctica.AAC.1
MDLLQSFSVGYHDGGVVEMRPRMIARHYARTWLALDIGVLVSDWSYKVVSSGDSTSGLMRVGKSVRFLRLLRLMRLIRLWK